MAEEKVSVVPTAALDAGMAAAFNLDGDSKGTVLQSICKEMDGVPSVVLKSGARADGKEPIVRPNSAEVPATGHHARYRIDGEIARGGMGAILRGRDKDLGRDLAVKVLLESHREKPAVVQRFIEEAQIGGQLQHPGIVPVYELGQFTDQRPFFSMKLVKGKTLSVLLSERENPEQDRTKLINIFEQVCQTMAYAHSRGVIHRDLKPSNIMVGAFGEVQVMDWGLAKVLGEGGVQDERRALERLENTSIIETIRSQGSDSTDQVGSQTKYGSVLGTPAYMPPEQALGEIDQVDERTDVFSLGAILCEILTGKPPYVSEKAHEVFRLATRGKLQACLQRLENAEIDTSLRGLVFDCLALEPVDRPRDSSVVAKRVNDYLESVEQRLHKTELEALEAVTRATEESKRRRITGLLAATFVILIATLSGGFVWTQQQQSKVASLVRDQNNARVVAVTKEIAAANTLVSNEGQSSPPTSKAISQALNSVERARDHLAGAHVGIELRSQVDQLHASLQSQLKDARLREELHAACDYEVRQYVEQSEHLQQIATSGQRRIGPEGDLISIAIRPVGISDSAALYERAFLNWGLSLDMEVEAIAKRIATLDSEIQEIAIVALDRWRLALSTIPDIQTLTSMEWSQFRPIELRSRGGDTLDALPDGSILASGDHPEKGYELTFETDATSISALRLETLFHESLPSNGPGRSSTGVFAVQGLTFKWAPKGSPDQVKNMKIESATSDFSWHKFPLTVHSWNGSAGGRDRELSAVFQLTKPIYSKSGFRIWINHRDREEDKWNDQNLGRFRWTIHENTSHYSNARLLEKLVEILDTDQWRIALRQAVKSDDVFGLLSLCELKESVNQQSPVDLVCLAHTIRNCRFRESLSTYLSNSTWDTPAESHMTRSDGTPVNQKEAVFSVENEESTSGKYQVFFRAVGKPVLRLRLNSKSREGCFIRNIRLFDRNANKEISVERVASEASQHWRIWTAVDSDPATYWQVLSQNSPAAYLQFQIEETNPTTQYCLTIECVEENNDATLAQIELMQSTDEIPDVSLAYYRYAQRLRSIFPKEHWANIAYAQACLRQNPPKAIEAVRYATAGASIAPKDLGASRVLISSLCSLVEQTGELDENTFSELERQLSLHSNADQKNQLLREIVDAAVVLAQEGQVTQAVDIMLRLRPHESQLEGSTLSWRLPTYLALDLHGESQERLELTLELATKSAANQIQGTIRQFALYLAQLHNGLVSEARATFDSMVDMAENNEPMDAWGYFGDSMLTFAEGDRKAAQELFRLGEEMRLADDPDNKLLHVFRNQAAGFIGRNKLGINK